MKKKKLYYLFMLALSCLLFTGGWVEDEVFEMELKPRISEPYIPVDQNFAVLQSRHKEVLTEKEILDGLFSELYSSTNKTATPDRYTAYSAGSANLVRTIQNLTNDIALFARANQNAFEAVLAILDGITAGPSRGSELLKTLQKNENKKQLYETWSSTTLLSLRSFLDDISGKKRVLEKKPKDGKTESAPLLKTAQTTALAPASITIRPEEIFQGLKTHKLPPDTKKSLSLYEEAAKLMENGQYAEAMKKFRQSLDYDGNNYKSMRRMTELYILDRQYDLAISMINRAIDIYKRNYVIP